MNLELLGYAAAFCTTFSFLPQAIKTIRSRDTSSLSLFMYSIFTFGVVLWFAYGVIIEDKALMVANFITALLAGVILFVKIKNDVFKGGSIASSSE
jgi:MtN3 and saliva related transmembrane protein